VTAPAGARFCLWPNTWPGTGLGDAIRGSRYLPAFAVAHPGVPVVVDATLARLFARLGPPIVGWPDAAPAAGGMYDPGDADRVRVDFAACAPGPGLPPLPPLWVDPGIALLDAPGRRVGLCGQAGNPDRRLPPAVVASLLDRTDVPWVGLHLAPDAALPLRGLAARGVRDFADTAGIVARCDLVITADTSVEHPAASLAVPTWVLCPADPHPSHAQASWRRWLAEGWYPTARLFPQPAPGDWASVIDQVQAALTAWRAGR